ncbi:MAG: DUF1349 domain-containing protein [Verrucomicrobiota bacterium]
MRTILSEWALVAAFTLTVHHSGRAEPAIDGSIQDLRFYAGLTAVGAPGVSYELQYTTNLQSPDAWTTLTNVVLDTNRLFFVDLDSPTSAVRFYRLRPVATNESSTPEISPANPQPITARSTDISKPALVPKPRLLKPIVVKDGWNNVVDPDHDCQVRTKDDTIHIDVPGTAHDFAAELQRWNAPRVLAQVDGDFVLEVKIHGAFQPAEPSTIEGRRPYHGAGLLLVQDKQNHLSLQRGAVLLGKKLRHYANFEWRHGPDAKVSNYEFEIEDRDISLRVARRGNRILAMASQDGVNWRAFNPIEVDFPQNLSVGVEAINSSKKPFSCSFHGLSLYRE